MEFDIKWNPGVFFICYGMFAGEEHVIPMSEDTFDVCQNWSHLNRERHAREQ
jgi:hypothetical protein